MTALQSQRSRNLGPVLGFTTQFLWIIFFIPEPAVILEKPEPMVVTAGNAFTLECTVGGTPELITKWLKDGRELANSRKHQISFSNKIATLKVLSADMNDRGLYTFEVHNEVGKSSCTSSVDVSGLLQIFLLNFSFLYLLPLSVSLLNMALCCLSPQTMLSLLLL